MKKGVLLCGGKGTRLAPLTKITNKHLLPIWNQPMAYWPMMTLKYSGVTDILLITTPDHVGDFFKYFKDGKEFDVNLSYAVQDEAKGIADALSLAEDFVLDDVRKAGFEPYIQKFAVILGDNIFGPQNFTKDFEEFYNSDAGAKVFLKRVSNWKDYGIAVVKNNKIKRIVEKPKRMIGDLAVTGLYLYSGDIFKKIKELKPSKRGELEITDINNWYLRRKKLDYKILDGIWFDAGESLKTYLRVNNIVSEYSSMDPESLGTLDGVWINFNSESEEDRILDYFHKL